jgi:hypothetical protein
MLNPWLAFSFKAARLGWETQSMMVDQLMAMAGVNGSGRYEARDAFPGSREGEPSTAAARTAAEAQTVTPVHAMKDHKSRKVAQQVAKGHKKQGRVSKRRRSK